jgi:hypothetical protein
MGRPLSTTSSSHTIVSGTEPLDPIDYEELSQSHSERDPLSQVRKRIKKKDTFLLVNFLRRIC